MLSYTNIEFTFAFTGGSVPLWHDLQRGLLCMQHIQAGPLSGQLLANLAGGLAGWSASAWLAGSGASAGCAPTAWLAKGLLAGPGLSFQAAFHRVAHKNKLVFDLVGQAFTAGILHRWQSTLGINKKESKKQKHNCTTTLKQDNKNRNTIVRLFSKRGGSHHILAMCPAGL